MSFDPLIAKITAMKNPTVMGLDPTLDFVPSDLKNAAFASHGETLEGAADALLRFNKALIDAVHEIIPAIKPQSAFYERYGWQGVRAMAETIAHAHAKGMYVIADVKRSDIGSTMEAYAGAWLGVAEVGSKTYAPFGSDAITVNGYLGTDTIEPLLDVCRKADKGIFVLAKTSNPSSQDLQDLVVDGVAIYEAMAALCAHWGESLPGAYGYSGVGAVVGATYPAQIVALRRRFPGLFFLVPGYGAQGGGGAGVAGAFDENGSGAIVNASRSLMCAWQNAPGLSLADATRAEALRMKKDIAAHVPALASA